MKPDDTASVAPEQFLNFDVEFGPAQAAGYLVEVRSPAGETQATLCLPFDQPTLHGQLQALELGLLRASPGRRRLALPAERPFQDFGRALFEGLFTEKVGTLYERSLDEAARRGCGLRLVLRFTAPELAALPWEFLYDTTHERYLCLSHWTPLVRYLELSRTIEPLTVTPPLRVLAMVAQPQDLDPLQTERERQRIDTVLGPLQAEGLLTVTWLNGQTWRDVQHMMLEEPWHIFHFIGHGGFDAEQDEGLLALADDDGDSYLLRASKLASLITDNRALRLVVLNACDGARGDAADLFSSTAAILVQQGIQAVVAMQYEISDAAALEFAPVFYQRLAAGWPVEVAVTEGRKAIHHAAESFEWGTPVLYLRALNGHIFDVTPRRPEQQRQVAALAPAAGSPPASRTPTPLPAERTGGPMMAAMPWLRRRPLWLAVAALLLSLTALLITTRMLGGAFAGSAVPTLAGRWQTPMGWITEYTLEGDQYVGRYIVIGDGSRLGFAVGEVRASYVQVEPERYEGRIRWRWPDGGQQWVYSEVRVTGAAYVESGVDPTGQEFSVVWERVP